MPPWSRKKEPDEVYACECGRAIETENCISVEFLRAGGIGISYYCWCRGTGVHTLTHTGYDPSAIYLICGPMAVLPWRNPAAIRPVSDNSDELAEMAMDLLHVADLDDAIEFWQQRPY